ncbi:MAG: TIGR02530 family flagellar biosynthesis protein [Clostridium sp.]|uniref:TIGR02530 family flagellar biosynthesis protein n=1 Tax=Clostridium sp. TaxID=1506 RepID=UPI00290E697C|nr:TIGR02530 family flagellar biosynthesis protein [Clostridium sp.]MDU7336995.1 TIGR02530 family flagellar biosynthesis protein [Clostridium sp.]
MNDLEFKKNYSALLPPSYGVKNTPPSGTQKPQGNQQNSEFAALVRQSIQKGSQLNFSKHAVQRLESRSIELSPERLTQLSGAVEKAREKGVREALIMDGTTATAFIVNIPSSTVITMINGGEMKENVFTNIDGAVIM